MTNSTRKAALLNWVKKILDDTGMSATELAKRAGISPSTITRVLEPDWKGGMRPLTIKAIAEATDTRPPAAMLPEPQGFTDREAEAYRAPADMSEKSLTMQRLVSSRNDEDTLAMMILQSSMLSASGLLPGDQLIVDLSKTPRAGDIVVAQHYDWRNGTAETIVRIYEPPYLIANTFTPRPQKPMMVDGENVVIKGVVIHIARDLAGAA